MSVKSGFPHTHSPSKIGIALRNSALLLIFLAFSNNPAQFRNDDTNDKGVILLTGFTPFGSNTINSSWEAVKQLDGLWIGNNRIVTVQLPVVWDQAGGQLRAAIDQFQPDLVINVGQGGNKLELVSRAHNVAGNIVDNIGARPRSPLIAADGPATYNSAVNITPIIAALQQANIPTVVSGSAGTYLCNFVSYSSYQYLAKVDSDTMSLFIHVPPIFSLETAKDRQTLAQLVTALKIILNYAN